MFGYGEGFLRTILCKEHRAVIDLTFFAFMEFMLCTLYKKQAGIILFG
jgi:hypothetical protein